MCGECCEVVGELCGVGCVYVYLYGLCGIELCDDCIVCCWFVVWWYGIFEIDDYCVGVGCVCFFEVFWMIVGNE